MCSDINYFVTMRWRRVVSGVCDPKKETFPFQHFIY